MSKKIYGYMRVSTKEQHEDRQLIALQELHIPRNCIYMDKQSGKDFDRPSYQKLIRRLKKGDHLYVKSIDRLGRNYKDIMEQWRILTKEIGADITILDMPLLDTSNSNDLLGTFISDIVLQLLSFVAENERDNIRKRQAEGIAAAKARGVLFGQPKKHPPTNFHQLFLQFEQKDLNIHQLSALCGMGISTTYTKLRLHRAALERGVELTYDR